MSIITRIDNFRYYKIDDLISMGHLWLKKWNNDALKYFEDECYEIDDDYIYARLEDDKWIKSDSDKDTLFVKSFMNNWSTSFDDEEKYPEEFELFMKDNIRYGDNSYPITVYGEKDYDKCFFNINDTDKFVKQKNALKKLITTDDEEFAKEVHYHYFYFLGENDENCHSVMLTYKGFIKSVEMYRPECLETAKTWVEMLLKPKTAKELRDEIKWKKFFEKNAKVFRLDC